MGQIRRLCAGRRRARGRRASPATKAGTIGKRSGRRTPAHNFPKPWQRRRRRREGARDADRLGAAADRKATACWRASSSPPPKPRPAKPTRPSPITMRWPSTRASIRFCKAMPRCKPRRSGWTRRTIAEMERRLKPLADSGSAWRFSARELLGLTAYRLNNMREAEKAIQRAGRRSGNSAEFAGARRHDARADRGNAAGA